MVGRKQLLTSKREKGESLVGFLVGRGDAIGEEEEEEAINVWILQKCVARWKVDDAPAHFSNHDLVPWAYDSGASSCLSPWASINGPRRVPGEVFLLLLALRRVQRLSSKRKTCVICVYICVARSMILHKYLLLEVNILNQYDMKNNDRIKGVNKTVDLIYIVQVDLTTRIIFHS